MGLGAVLGRRRLVGGVRKDAGGWSLARVKVMQAEGGCVECHLWEEGVAEGWGP